MRKGRFFKKAALAAAICLSLTQSVWAMPTGGTLVDGGAVTGFESDPTTGATFTTTGPSIINWGAFNIAAGESMYFDTAGGALLNRVTGADPSLIAGFLSQTGANPMFLVNPNGILVGPSAHINASNLVLSTLDMSNDNFTNGNYIFTTPNGKSIAAPLQIQGAKIEGDFLAAFGGTVEVADGVTFTGTGTNVELAAAKTVSGLQYPDITSDASNVVTVSNIDTGNGIATIDMQGGTINLANAAITAADNFYAEAFSLENGVKNYSAGGGVNAEHVSVTAGGETKITGKTVDLTTVQFSGMDNVKLIAADKGEWNEPTRELSFSMTPDNTVTANTLRIENAKMAKIIGGKVNLTTADISTIRNTSDKRDTGIIAAPGAVINYKYPDNETNPTFTSMSGQPADYSVSLKGVNIKLETEGTKGDPSIDIGGGKITLDQSKIELTGGDDNGVHLFAFSNATGTDDDQIITADPTNVITLQNGSSIISKGERLAIAGGKIVIRDTSSVEKISENPNKPGLFVVSSNEIGWDNANKTYTTAYPVAKGSQGTIAVSQDSRILLNGNDVTDQFATTRSIISDEVVLPTDPTDLANLESGFDKMEAVFAKANAGNIQDLTRGLVTDINKESSADNRAKAAQVSGVILAIWQNESLSADAKKALEQEVIQTFYPTQNVLTVSLNNLGN